MKGISKGIWIGGVLVFVAGRADVSRPYCRVQAPGVARRLLCAPFLQERASLRETRTFPSAR